MQPFSFCALTSHIEFALYSSITSCAHTNSFMFYYYFTTHRPIPLTQCCTINSDPLAMKRFIHSISISFKCECYIIMQMQTTKSLNIERFELGTTMS